MATPLRIDLARWCLQTRLELDITQAQVAIAAGVSRSLVVSIEAGTANPSLDIVDRVGRALGVEFDLGGRRPLLIGGPHQRDLVHARCSGYVQRRLTSAGFQIAREIEVIHGRTHGWIDLLAFDPRTGLLLIVEVKTSIDDLGAIERQVGWYERLAVSTALERGWRPEAVFSWLLVLATTNVDQTIRMQRDVLQRAFPMRAAAMRAMLNGQRAVTGTGRGLALIDPSSRRRDWLLPSRSDGRRSDAPYLDYSDALRRMEPPFGRRVVASTTSAGQRG
jgi:transcriptional regulator with XRE-family HTH domain